MSHPIAPIGTKVVIYEPADKRPSWSQHGIAGYYLGPALKHYRSVKCYVPSTNRIRTSNQCDFFPEKFMFPGASTAEILLTAINKLQSTIDTNVDLTTLDPVIQQVKEATRDYTLNYVPPGPRAPDGISNEEVAALNPPPNLLPTPIATPPTDAAPDVMEPERVNRTDNIDTNNVDVDFHPLKTHKAARPADNDWRVLTPAESRNTYNLTLKDRIGQHFTDTETKEEFIIDSLVMKNIAKGKQSKTPFYRMFLVCELERPTAVREYEYTPCSEIIHANWVKWIPRGLSSIAMAITASEPRDLTRALNLTRSGKPLKFKSAMDLDRDLWTNCSIEEWHRLHENTLRPIYSSEIPKGEKVSYYNQQVKEKETIINGIRYIVARVRGTLGGDKLEFQGVTSANTADYTLFKTLISATLHDVKFVDPATRFVTIDAVDYYLFSPMEEPAYMMVPIKDIPMEIVNAYNLTKRAKHGKVYFKILM
jgi:hypothetical protein